MAEEVKDLNQEEREQDDKIFTNNNTMDGEVKDLKQEEIKQDEEISAVNNTMEREVKDSKQEKSKQADEISTDIDTMDEKVKDFTQDKNTFNQDEKISTDNKSMDEEVKDFNQENNKQEDKISTNNNTMDEKVNDLKQEEIKQEDEISTDKNTMAEEVNDLKQEEIKPEDEISTNNNAVYSLQSSRNVNIELTDDTVTCRPFGCCLTHDNQLLVTDSDNQKIKRIDTGKMTVIDYCVLNGRPFGIDCTNKQMAVVACQYPNMIQFVSIENKMKPTRKIATSHNCYGVAVKDDHLYVTDSYRSLFVYDINGKLLRTIKRDNNKNELFTVIRNVAFNESGDKMFVGDLYKGLVCFDGEGTYLSTIKDNDLDGVVGVCSGGKGHIFVTGYRSRNVVQLNEDGKKIAVMKPGDGQKTLLSISFCKKQNMLFVSKYNI